MCIQIIIIIKYLLKAVAFFLNQHTRLLRINHILWNSNDDSWQAHARRSRRASKSHKEWKTTLRRKILFRQNETHTHTLSALLCISGQVNNIEDTYRYMGYSSVHWFQSQMEFGYATVYISCFMFHCCLLPLLIWLNFYVRIQRSSHNINYFKLAQQILCSPFYSHFPPRADQ